MCEEAATYRQGTNTRTETRQVFRQELFRREDFEIEAGCPSRRSSTSTVPAGAMHSFKADHNEINWTLVVEGRRGRLARLQTVLSADRSSGPRGALPDEPQNRPS